MFGDYRNILRGVCDADYLTTHGDMRHMHTVAEMIGMSESEVNPTD